MRLRVSRVESLASVTAVFPIESNEDVSCELDWKSVSRLRPAFTYIGNRWVDLTASIPEQYREMNRKVVVEFRFPFKKAKVHVEIKDLDGLPIFETTHIAIFTDAEYNEIKQRFVNSCPEELCMDPKAWEIQKAMAER